MSPSSIMGAVRSYDRWNMQYSRNQLQKQRALFEGLRLVIYFLIRPMSQSKHIETALTYAQTISMIPVHT